MRETIKEGLPELVGQFRSKINLALDKGKFEKDPCFNRFPKECCGDTCYLLGEYLRLNGFETIYVCGDDHGQTHAWLVLKDFRVKKLAQRVCTLPKEIAAVYSRYNGNKSCGFIDCTRYEKADLEAGLIIDITADQFGELPVYIGIMNVFYSKFDFCEARDYTGILSERLMHLYQKIVKDSED